VRFAQLNLELMLRLYIPIGCDFLETCLCQTKHLEIITCSIERMKQGCEDFFSFLEKAQFSPEKK